MTSKAPLPILPTCYSKYITQGIIDDAFSLSMSQISTVDADWCSTMRAFQRLRPRSQVPWMYPSTAIWMWAIPTLTRRELILRPLCQIHLSVAAMKGRCNSFCWNLLGAALDWKFASVFHRKTRHCSYTAGAVFVFAGAEDDSGGLDFLVAAHTCSTAL